jgi:hypothetical protein
MNRVLTVQMLLPLHRPSQSDAKFWHGKQKPGERDELKKKRRRKLLPKRPLLQRLDGGEDLQQIWPTLLDLKHTLCLFASAHCSEMVMIPTQLLNGL